MGPHSSRTSRCVCASRQADALAAYQRACRAYAEIGLAPGPELQDLEDAIILNKPGLDWSPPAGRPGREPLPVEPHRRPEPPARRRLLLRDGRQAPLALDAYLQAGRPQLAAEIAAEVLKEKVVAENVNAYAGTLHPVLAAGPAEALAELVPGSASFGGGAGIAYALPPLLRPIAAGTLWALVIDAIDAYDQGNAARGDQLSTQLNGPGFPSGLAILAFRAR